MTHDVPGEIAAAGRYLAERGLAPGSSGNLSVRRGDTILVTPTNSRLGALDPSRISLVRMDGTLLHGDRPSKETLLHLTVYAARPESVAVVHLHSTYSVAVSCLAEVDPTDVLPPLTAYSLMRLGRVPLVPFHPPGSRELAVAVAGAARGHKAMLLSNHGPLVASGSLWQAVTDAEEMEQTTMLTILLRGSATRPIPVDETEALRQGGGG